ncbi:beta-1,3-galactosyltransferase 5 [Helicoverpa zea]|uniref:beta-1,3-galactosyltransferase 5 n=1 Tax=Helicoverpa zea TaxID=7113 RepID=UPI001F55E425|nr:beta-1,3-galactosyltransferase 5 [Helicoverpa zea]
MRRKFVYMSLLFGIVLTSWIYWKSNTEFNNTVTILRRKSYTLIDVTLKPVSTTCKSQTFLVIIVTSYVGHVELRSAHRRAMPAEELRKVNATRVFLLAQIPEKEKYITQSAINDESNTFGDILQGKFVENYRNLTYKHLMGLKWASTTCHEASFILKVDDDTVYNLNKTYNLLKTIDNPTGLLMGYMLNNTKPRRNKENKWYVTYDEYPRSEYPSYLSGWYYITTPKVAAALCDEAIYHPYLWIDDIFVSGLLRESLGIKLKQLPDKFWLAYYELLECCLNDMIKKSIKCDYVVGPNGGRNNLILEFNDAIRNCNSWSNCTVRSQDQDLEKKCIAHKERTIFGDGGKAEIQYVKLK